MHCSIRAKHKNCRAAEHCRRLPGRIGNKKSDHNGRIHEQKLLAEMTGFEPVKGF